MGLNVAVRHGRVRVRIRAVMLITCTMTIKPPALLLGMAPSLRCLTARTRILR